MIGFLTMSHYFENGSAQVSTMQVLVFETALYNKEMQPYFHGELEDVHISGE